MLPTRSVTHAHGVAHLVQRLVGDGVRLLVALFEHITHVIHVLGEFRAALTVRSQEPVHGFDDVLLQRASAGLSPIAIPMKPASTGSIRPNATPPMFLNIAAMGVIVPKLLL